MEDLCRNCVCSKCIVDKTCNPNDCKGEIKRCDKYDKLTRSKK